MRTTDLVKVFCGCLTLAGAVQLSAASQQNPSTNSGGTQRSDTSSGDGAKIILQGCLARASSASSTPGAAGTSGSSGSFTLTKAERKGPAAGKTLPSAGGAEPTTIGQPGVPGSSGAPGFNGTNSAGGTAVAAGQIAATYTLSGKDEELAAHVGQRVELTGTLEPLSASTRQGGTTTAQGAGNSTQGGTVSGVPQKLVVEEVKTASGSCDK